MSFKRRVLSALGKDLLLEIGRGLELEVTTRMGVEERCSRRGSTTWCASAGSAARCAQCAEHVALVRPRPRRDRAATIAQARVTASTVRSRRIRAAVYTRRSEAVQTRRVRAQCDDRSLDHLRPVGECAGHVSRREFSPLRSIARRGSLRSPTYASATLSKSAATTQPTRGL